METFDFESTIFKRVGLHDGLVLSIDFLLIITDMVFGIGKTLPLNLLLYDYRLPIP